MEDLNRRGKECNDIEYLRDDDLEDLKVWMVGYEKRL